MGYNKISSITSNLAVNFICFDYSLTITTHTVNFNVWKHIHSITKQSIKLNKYAFLCNGPTFIHLFHSFFITFSVKKPFIQLKESFVIQNESNFGGNLWIFTALSCSPAYKYTNQWCENLQLILFYWQ